MILLFSLACLPDDVDSPAATDQDAAASGGLAGDWLSEGDDVSPLFASDPFNYTTIDASFGTDGSYQVVVTDDSGQSGTLTGTYTADTSTTPAAITLQQSTPYTAVASGIFEITGDLLTYEVVQTSPDYGFVPPTPESGFGSTSGPDLEAGVNVQTYVAVGG